MRKFVFGGLLAVAAFVAGLLFMIRGCLSRYDERSAVGPVLFFPNEKKQLLFSVIQSEEATSYSQKGGFTQKTVSTTYLIQSNDAVTGEKIAVQKVKRHKDIRSFPVESVAAWGQLAWVYLGELMAFDPLTLEKKADTEILEKLNPASRGLWPQERRYYDFDTRQRRLLVTLSDGSRWQLDSASLLLKPVSETSLADDPDQQIGYWREQVQAGLRQQDSLYLLLRQQKISSPQFAGLRQQIQQQRDSLYRLIRDGEKKQREQQQLHRRQEQLSERYYPSYSQMHTSVDTTGGRLYTVLSAEEMRQANVRIQWQQAYGDAVRRMLYTAPYFINKYEEAEFEKTGAVRLEKADFLLDGGFLLDKTTAQPIRLSNPDSWLFVGKSRVGRDGTIVLKRIDQSGNIRWQFDTGLTEWAHWLWTGNRLLVLGADNQELGHQQTHLLWTISLEDGNARGYDYFSDTPRLPKH
ncbi:MAG: PA2928 family protein [Chitinophagaceae bacterium]